MGFDQHTFLAYTANCDILRSLASDSLRKIQLEAFERDVGRHQTIVSDGEIGDALYIILDGTAEVWQTGFYDSEPALIKTISAGDFFGYYALITGHRQNKTVRMTSDGKLLVVPKNVFDQFIRPSLVCEIHAHDAKQRIESGYQLIDVRYEEEFAEGFISGATLIPLPDLEKRITEINRTNKYVVYCHSGKRSAVAAMKMKQRGIDAVSLVGGISEWPFENVSQVTGYHTY